MNRTAMRPRRLATGIAVLVLAGLPSLLAGCRKAAPAPPPSPQVVVLTVQGQTIPAQTEWVGQAAASKSVQIRAQVSGVIVARPYVEGTDVRKGSVLYRIDPRTYLANYRSARARLAENEAQLANAARTLNRLTPLLAARAVAQQDVDNAQAAFDQYRAAVEDAQAEVEAAKKNYDDTFVRAEVDGRAGRALFELGALASGPTDLLTTVEQVDPIYVFFNPSDQDVLQWRRDIAGKRLLVPPGVLDVQATLSDGTVFGQMGKLRFIDLALQPNTGALQLRATFPNPQHTLLPGQYLRVRILGLKRTDAILLPQRAVQQGLSSQFVYLLGNGNKVTAQNITATGWDGTQWLVEDGLRQGDKVIVDGAQKVMPGQPVRPVAYHADTDTTLVAGDGPPAVAPPAAAPPIWDTPRRQPTRPIRDTLRREAGR